MPTPDQHQLQFRMQLNSLFNPSTTKAPTSTSTTTSTSTSALWRQAHPLATCVCAICGWTLIRIVHTLPQAGGLCRCGIGRSPSSRSPQQTSCSPCFETNPINRPQMKGTHMCHQSQTDVVAAALLLPKISCVPLPTRSLSLLLCCVSPDVCLGLGLTDSLFNLQASFLSSSTLFLSSRTS